VTVGKQSPGNGRNLEFNASLLERSGGHHMHGRRHIACEYDRDSQNGSVSNLQQHGYDSQHAGAHNRVFEGALIADRDDEEG
jgi:hypothetical protein